MKAKIVFDNQVSNYWFITKWCDLWPLCNSVLKFSVISIALGTLGFWQKLLTMIFYLGMVVAAEDLLRKLSQTVRVINLSDESENKLSFQFCQNNRYGMPGT